MKLNSLDKKILAKLSFFVADSKNPYRKIAKDLKINEKILIKRINILKGKGVIERFSASIDYKKFGYRKNSLIAWILPLSREKDIKGRLKSINFLSHAYIRKPNPNFKYNLYTMIHAKTKKELDACFDILKKTIGSSKYLRLDTLRELKKTSFIYHE